MDQRKAPILDALEAYHQHGRYGYTPPGHRQGRGLDKRTLDALGPDAFHNDVLASAGLDDRSSTNGYLAQAQELMAEAVGADHAFFSTCGSSLSVKAAILAVTRGTGDILIGRDAHKSVTAGLILSGLQPRWIRPRWDDDLHLAHPPSPEAVEAMWQRHPDAAACLIVSPTPYGTCADIQAIAGICHLRGKPLIVDEAWGAHLPFHDSLPTWAMDAGADICVVSVHKMGLGFEQGSVYHLQGPLVDPVRLRQCADLLATTSTSVLVYAGMDAWRRQMVRHGGKQLGAALDLVAETRGRINDLPGMHVLHDELIREEASHDFDPLHVLIDLQQLGISGYQAADWLRENARIDVGLNDHRRIEATFSQADDRQSANRLLDALESLVAAAAELPVPPPVQLPDSADLEMETVQLPRDAFFGPVEVVPASEAAGRIAAEQITPYPPGVPAILPGERINGRVVEYLVSGKAAGMVLPDPADPTLETIRVVQE
ncbi:aminotransferase class I/II-fold pyridoxal phosphate-dependent enzyme [Arthrobacter sp. 7Tela_A1]|uniref:aminotransferase class I/II-fold pyridoxal phosphate-dependent enzyme n=1 Tax=Arthrobacter sp. 7Tela_A1 TaxID=3093745 RepID=UPI003BB75C6C